MKKYEVIFHIGLPETEITDDILNDLQKAIKHASYNLYGRHKVYVVFDTLEQKGTHTVTLKLLDIEEILTKENIPIHLKGIASYLLREYPDKYKPLKYGNRLLHYNYILELEAENNV